MYGIIIIVVHITDEIAVNVTEKLHHLFIIVVTIFMIITIVKKYLQKETPKRAWSSMERILQTIVFNTIFIIIIVIIIIITRRRPAFGRLGLGGSSGGYSSCE